MQQKIGSWAFILGVVLAIVIALLGSNVLGPAAAWVPMLFVILGVLVGILNVTDKEIHEFLLAVIALMVAGAVNWSVVPTIGVIFGSIFQNITALMAPAAVIVAIKTVWNLARLN